MINAVVDLSHHNTLSDVAGVKAAGILGCLHKATQGVTFVDPTFASHRKRIEDAGILFGAYHFGVGGSVGAQVDHFLSTAGDDTLLVLDFEPNPQGHDMTLLEAEEFVHQVFVQTGAYPGLYSGHTIKEALSDAHITDPSQTELSKCWLWLAQYSDSPLLPRIWKNWTLWQYTDGAHGSGPYVVDGIGRCDRDQFQGSADDLAAGWEARRFS